MDLSRHVETLRRELGSLTRFAADDVARAADLLADALDAPVRLTMLEVLSAAAAEITARLDNVVVDLRLSGGEPDFVVTDVPAQEHSPTPGQRAPGPDCAEDSGTARITLRLSESVKARVETEAAAAGLSVNAWLAHAVIRALDSPASQPGARSRSGFGQRVTGYARG